MTAPHRRILFVRQINQGMKLLSKWVVLGLLLGATTAGADNATDWLIDPAPYKAAVKTAGDGREVELNNGLVRRGFRLQPDAACIAFDNLVTGESLLRSVRPEARVAVDGTNYEVGGLLGQRIHNFLKPEWLAELKANPNAFHFIGMQTGKTAARFAWQKHPEWMPHDAPWPPPGVSLVLRFARSSAPALSPPARGLLVEVHYELYDGLPLLCKWLVVSNLTDTPHRLNAFTAEVLAAAEGESAVGNPGGWRLPNLLVETDYAFGGSMSAEGSSASVHWLADPGYKSQVNYDLKTPCLLECRPPQGPDQELAPGATFESFRVFELARDGTDRERQGLAQRRMYRAIAPWVTENPVLMHVRSARPEAVRLAIDQCAEVGFEMVILTFGSGFNFESRDKAYQDRIKELADYGRTKHIALGGYSLLASRGAATPADNTVGTNMFGVAPCLGAKWGQDYLAQLKDFIATAGLGVLEHDGSYPGDKCASTNHPFHRGFADSQWVQWRAITDLYQWCRGRGVYLNIPDWYFLSGGNKTGMGYREVNWSLPREHQEIIERQNIFDGTWEKTPSMGWMFVPLTEYQGGGAAATIEPLKDHLAHYEQRLANLFGAGVIACYRGPRLYDTDETKAVVKRWTDFYHRHREVLNSDLIHLRRADARDLDYLLHVNPSGNEKGLLMVYNPLDQEVRRVLSVPLYYTGLRGKARVSEREGAARSLKLDSHETAALPVTVPARGVTWFLFR